MKFAHKLKREDWWMHSSSADDLPDFAIKAGYDCDGTPIYVGRAEHQGELLPAKVIPSKGCAYVSWGGQEHSKNHYEILYGPGYRWCVCEGGAVPSTAVSTGETDTSEPLYIGRGHHANSLTVGKIHPSHGCLYIPFGGQEISLNTYEVLVRERDDKWESCGVGDVPVHAVASGRDTDDTNIYVGRSYHEGRFIPAKVVPNRSEAYICCDGAEIKVNDIEILCGENYSWQKVDGGNIPNNAVFTGRFADGEPLFVGRTHHCDALTPGLVSSRDHCIFIPYGGREIRKHDYEILVRD